MQIINFPTSFPFLFLAVAVVWSVFQGYAGVRYGLYIYDSAYEAGSRKPFVRLMAYGLHHGAFYCLCSFSGFAAWCLLRGLSEKIGNWSEVAGGTGAILIALAVFSVLGVSGGLPRILYLGNRPV
jgi:hypothetical protein